MAKKRGCLVDSHLEYHFQNLPWHIVKSIKFNRRRIYIQFYSKNEISYEYYPRQVDETKFHLKISEIPNIPVRLKNILNEQNIIYLEELYKFTKNEVLWFRNLGKGSMLSLINLMHKHKINFSDSGDSPIKITFDGLR